jgi:signal transduction histidine kinase
MEAVVLGHEDRLEHVISHLLQNAIDATSSTGLIEARLEADERFIHVVISDTGSGMTPEFLRDRLFRPFQTTKHSGMGIGVYESAQYLASLGGSLDVASQPNVGTTVRIRLPRAESGSATDSAALKEPIDTIADRSGPSVINVRVAG